MRFSGRFSYRLAKHAADRPRPIANLAPIAYQCRGSPNQRATAAHHAIATESLMTRPAFNDAFQPGPTFETLFDLTLQPGWTANAEGRVDFYNRAWCEHTGTTLEQALARGLDGGDDSSARGAAGRGWQQHFKDGNAFEKEVFLRGSDGLSRPFLCRLTPVRDHDGTLVRWIALHTEMSPELRIAEQSESLHAAILRNMAEGVCLVRVSDRIIVYTSPKFDAMLGYLEGELVGREVSSINCPLEASTAERVADEIINALEPNGVARYEVANRRKDGSRVWCRAQTSRLAHPKFGPVWVAIHEDITERRATEEERDGFFEMSLELLGVASFDGRFKRLNPVWEQTLGWSREELTSRPWLDFVHPDDHPATIAAGNRLQAGLELITFANRYRCRDGSYRWLEWKCMPILQRGIIYAAARDVTVAKQAELKLQEVTESLATTLRSIAEAVIASDATGAIAHMNPAAEQLTGWTLAEAKDRPVEQVLTMYNEATGAQVEAPVYRALREGTVVALASGTLLRRRDGEEIPIADSCAPMRSADGTTRGAVLVLRDVSAEREADAAQQKFKQQLVFADRMASVGTLAAGMAHEINNPLAYASANVETALDEIRTIAGGSPAGRMRELEEMLLDARDGVARVAKIVRGLKTFSRIDEHRTAVVDLVPVIELSINMAYNEVRHRARLVKDYGRVPHVDADDARLGQVFINLIVNAAQSFGESTVEANEIRVVTSTDAEGRAVVEVRDTGPGIPPAVITRIFDPFFTTKPVGLGTGLGLAISHNIVTGMGGAISVQSELGRGTVFRVVLPPSASAELTPADGARRPRLTHRKVNVLVVDDEPAIGKAVSRILRDHEVTVVSSARAALDLLDLGRDYDLILSDVMMPTGSGMQFYAALLARHPAFAPRVAFVSGGAFTPEAAAFLDGVDNERIEKPFQAERLRELVAKFVR